MFIEMIRALVRLPMGVMRVKVELKISMAELTLLASRLVVMFITPVKYISNMNLNNISLVIVAGGIHIPL